MTLNTFLQEVQGRAYRMAFAACKNEADALDIVQDAMTSLVKSYRDADSEEWPMLFQRILQNRIVDHHRKQFRVLNIFSRKPVFDDDDAGADDMDNYEAQQLDTPELLQNASDIERVLSLVNELPLRQQQVFMLRAVEQFNVEETAQVLACSSGSIKSHYFRALQTLRAKLEVLDEHA